MGESKVNLEQIKEDWLVGNAVVAFVGAFLMAQAWEPPDVKNAIPILDVTVPTLPPVVVLVFVALLSISSFVLALASTVPPIRSWAIQLVSPYSHVLELLMLVAYILSLIAALNELPADQWWAKSLWFGGVALLFFLWGRMMLRPIISPAKSLGRLLFRLVPRVWIRFIKSRRRHGDDHAMDGQ